jgi:hypothetical protein
MSPSSFCFFTISLNLIFIFIFYFCLFKHIVNEGHCFILCFIILNFLISRSLSNILNLCRICYHALSNTGPGLRMMPHLLSFCVERILFSSESRPIIGFTILMGRVALTLLLIDFFYIESLSLLSLSWSYCWCVFTSRRWPESPLVLLLCFFIIWYLPLTSNL